MKARARGRVAVDIAMCSRHIYQSVNQRLIELMYAIFRSGDKQFRAEPGLTIKVPSLDAEVGDTVTFDQVLMTSGDDGVTVGAPTVEGATVVGEVLRHGKGKKVIIFKWKRRKNYRRKQGHRQKFTEVRIGEIRAG